jgi:hypothetical protein
MNKDQAADIQGYLLKAAAAIDEASVIASRSGLEERAILFKIADALHFEVLPAIYRRYPELKPPEQPPVISSLLRWDEVVLPSSVSAADIDAILLPLLKRQLQKVALIVGLASKRSQELHFPTAPEVFGARLTALVEAGRIEGRGDLRKWGHSEVRLRG